MNITALNKTIQQEKICIPILLSVILIGIAIKIKFIFQESLWPDEALYLYISKNLSQDINNLTDISGKVFYESPPLLMYLLSLVSRIKFIEFDQAARAVILTMSSGTLLTTYFIGRKLYNPTVGILAALFLMVCPLTNWNGIRILTDMPVVFFIYLSINMLVYDKKIAFFFFALCAVFTKYSAFPLLFLPFFVKIKPKVWISIYLIGFIFLLLFVLSKSHFPAPKGWISYFYEFIQMPNLGDVAKETEFFIGYFLIGFTVIGMFQAIIEKKYSALFHWICIFGLCRIFLPWVVFRVSRYTLPIYPGLYLFAAYGCYKSFESIISKWPSYKKLVTLLFVVSIVSVLYHHMQRSLNLLKATSNTYIGYQKADAFLMSQSGSHSIATASPTQTKYYAPEFDVYDISKNVTPEELKAFLNMKKIRYISIDFWLPHLPCWCRSYDYQNNGYTPLYRANNVYLFEVVSNDAIK